MCESGAYVCVYACMYVPFVFQNVPNHEYLIMNTHIHTQGVASLFRIQIAGLDSTCEYALTARTILVDHDDTLQVCICTSYACAQHCCVRVCVWVYIYIYIYTHTHTHAYENTYIHVCICIYIYIYIYR
jgi:hypothetical protein